MTKCPKCNWVYPDCTTRRRCKFCGSLLSAPTNCIVCGAETDNRRTLHRITSAPLCTNCINHLVDLSNGGVFHFVEYDNLVFDSWMRLHDKNYSHTLTEHEWLKACAHFNGCALCGNEHVSNRGYFVPFRSGGKYCAHNIIPLCDDCNGFLRGYTNPFKLLRARANNIDRQTLEVMSGSTYRKRLVGIVKYLYDCMEDIDDELMWKYKGTAAEYLRTFCGKSGKSE